MHLAVNHRDLSSVEIVHLRQSGDDRIGKLPEKGELNDLFIYTLSGTIIIKSGSKSIGCNPNSVCLLDEETLDEIALTEYAEGFAIIVSRHLIREICATETPPLDLEQKGENRPIEFRINELFQTEVKELIYKLVNLYAITFSQEGMQRRMLRIFLLYISFGRKSSEFGYVNCRDQDLTNRFKQLVAQATVKKTIEQYAMELQISRNYLSRTFKKCSGQSPVRYIQQRFVQTARQLALQTPLSMKEVGYKLGFDDPAHFSKFFKMNTGLNFTEYKKQILRSANNKG
jgi:AraC-like DNA-binding protein